MEGVPKTVPLPCIGTFCDVSSMDACVPLFAKSMSSSQSEGIGHSFLRDVKQWHHPETLHNTIFGWHHGWPWTRATGKRELVFLGEIPYNVFLLKGRPNLEELIVSIIDSIENSKSLLDLHDLGVFNEPVFPTTPSSGLQDRDVENTVSALH